MRVAMGLSLREVRRRARAIEFYDLLSSLDFSVPTPTLFTPARRATALLVFPDNGVDDLDGIFKGIKGQRAARQVLGGLRHGLDAGARTRRAIKARTGIAGCRAFSESCEHTAVASTRAESARCGVRLSGDVAPSTSETFSIFGRTLAMTGAGRTT